MPSVADEWNVDVEPVGNGRAALKYLAPYVYRGWCYQLARQPQAEPLVKPPMRCDQCGGELLLVAITDGCGSVLWKHSLPYLDSG